MADPKVLVIVLAGGEGKRLLPLTNDRAKPAVPFGGSYRLIDFALSNFANAGLTQDGRAHAVQESQPRPSHQPDVALLDDAAATTSRRCRRRCVAGRSGSPGSADAIYQNLNLISDENPDLVCVFGADHIYRMDPQQLIDHHLESGAGVTVAAIPVPKHEAREFGVIEFDADGRILAFHEKVAEPPTMPGDDQRCLASMGNYVFDTRDADRGGDAA